MSTVSPVSAVALTSASTAVTATPTGAQVQSDLLALSTALKSGSLTNAQQAFATLQKDAPSLVPTGAASPSNPLSSTLTAVGTALRQGNVSGAEQAFASFQIDRAHAQWGASLHSLAGAVPSVLSARA
jgi:hypothetical protein